MVWKIDNPQCNESRKIVWEVAPYLRGRGVDIGAGDFKVLPHVISVDNMHHAQFGFSMRPDIMANADDLGIIASQSLDFVYSSHTLEHMQDTEKTLKEWWRVVKQGGYLVMYLPHKNFYPNIGEIGANTDHKHDFLPEDVIEKMPDGWDLIECQERNGDQEYSFLLVFKKINSKTNVRSYLKDRPSKTVLVVRYGAYGDIMMASSVFKGLKDQGYHVTVFAAPPGSDAIAHDPNIDKLVLFDPDQVPNADLGNFLAWQRKKYQKFVNLCESVEGTFLALPGRVQHGWSPLVRHSMMNRNYLEFQHELAEIPHKPQIKFYALDEEKKWARKTREKMGVGPVIMYSLAGSSVHKTWPGMDNIVAGMMLHSMDVHVVLVGGADCVILEGGWQDESRVHKTCGKWNIRNTFAFLEECDIVIGPETGVLNAASCMPVPKIVFLSHSSHENLTRDWVNVYPMTNPHTICPRRIPGVPACHTLHYGWEYCERDADTSTARCQADISVEQVWTVLQKLLYETQNRKVA